VAVFIKVNEISPFNRTKVA